MRINESNGEISRARSLAFFSQQLCGDEVNEALTPAGALHDQKTTASIDDVADGFFLAFTKCGVFEAGTQAKQFNSAARIVRHYGRNRATEASVSRKWSQSCPPAKLERRLQKSSL